MTVDLKPTSVTCPKCGFTQEEQSDCRKCGVVFSKYYALHNPAKSFQVDALEQPTAKAAEESSPIDPNEYRRVLFELQRQFNAIEFERAERNRISSEINLLNRKLEAGLSEVLSRLTKLEELTGQAPLPAQPFSTEGLAEFKRDLLEAYVEPLIHRFEQIEEGVTALNSDSAPKTDPRILDVLSEFEVRVTELESRASKPAHEPARQAAGDRVAQLEDSLGGLTRELASLKEALAGIKESEVTSAMEMGSRLAELDTKINDTASTLSGLEQKLEILVLDLKRVDHQYQSLSESVEKTLKLTKEIPQQASVFDSEFVLLHAECEALRAEIIHILEKVEGHLENRPERPPLEEDVHVIRQDLDELLRFIGGLTRKS